MKRSFLDAIIVTGASRGLGRAVAIMAGNLAPVLCIARSNTVETTCAEIVARGGTAESLTLDLLELRAIDAKVGAWISARSHGRLAIVLAAGTLGSVGGLLDSDLRDWAQTFQTNVLGNLAGVKALLPRMQKSRFGRIVTFAGGGAAYAYPLFSGYAISKTAMVRATENLDAELRDKGDFLSVCIAPGAMETEMLAQVRAAGAEVRTTVPIQEPVEFVRQFIEAKTCGFSGRFVHVRDDWRSWLNSTALEDDRWLLRRLEK
jgi:NAD(P)-dependent dehydrogenase (short-subunit alcohol dehydrogenase family)